MISMLVANLHVTPSKEAEAMQADEPNESDNAVVDHGRDLDECGCLRDENGECGCLRDLLRKQATERPS